MSHLLSSIRAHSLGTPRRIALSDTTSSISYQALPAQITARARTLRNANARVVALDLPNSVDWVLWDLACIQANCVCVPVPPFYTPKQKVAAFVDAGVDHCITTTGLTAQPHKAVDMNHDIAKISYTSGSTGTPKGVCLTQNALETVALSLISTIGSEVAADHVSVLPLAVLLENVAGVYSALICGCTVHLPETSLTNTRVSALHASLTHYRASTIVLVPELLRALVLALESGYPTLPHLRFVAVGGALVSQRLLTRASACGLPVYQGYGLTESASVVALNTPLAQRTNSAGKVLPHATVDIRNGEIVLINPAFSGYLHGDSVNEFATGDLGSIDADGFLTITGRSKNTLITAWGRNVSPEWIELELQDERAITQVLVYGDGESSLSALLVPTQDADARSIATAVARANDRLPSYARIGHWQLTTPFTTANGLLTGNGRMRRQHIINTLTHTPCESTLEPSL